MHTPLRALAPRRFRLAVIAGVLGTATACGSSAPVELPVSGIEPASSQLEATDGHVEEPPADEPTVEEPEVEAERAEQEPGTDQPATSGSSSDEAPTPDPAFEEPDLVVDENGCVTDRNLGLVIMCEDPAAGPDEGLG